MKSKSIILTAMLTALPSALMAQENIQKAFDALLSDNIVEIHTQHSLERDPETGQKTSQADVYDLMITDPSAIQCFKDIQQAFEKDKEAAYTVSSNERVGNNYVSLAVGNSNSSSVAIGKMKGSKYVYACFLDKDDPDKKYRYAYAMEWTEKDKKTMVRLAVTYATTLKYRQSKRQIKSIVTNGKVIKVDGNNFSYGSWTPFDDSSVFNSDSVFFNREKTSESWLSEFNTFKNLYLKNLNGAAASHFASYIYKLCKNAQSLEDVEKNMVSKEIQKLKNKTEDEFIQQLFDMSIERLKK